MPKNDNLQDYLNDLYQGIANKKPNASKNPQNFRDEIESIETGIDTTDGTATSNDILLGKTAYVNDVKLEGTIESYNSEITDGAEIINNTLDITANGEYDVKEYAKANVNVEAKFELELGTNVLQDGVFKNSNITSVKAENVTFLYAYVFQNCGELENVNLSKLSQISGEKCFEGCTNLRELTFPNLKSIYSGNQSFYQSGLRIIRFPILQILNGGYNYFGYCNDLTDIYFGYQGIVEISSKSIFQYAPTGIKVHVRSEYAEQYATATNWTVLITDGTIAIVGDYVD